MANGSPKNPNPKAYEFDVDVKSAFMAPIFLKVKSPMDVMKVIKAYALKMQIGLIILSAIGDVGNVVLPKTTKKYFNEGVYPIISLSGRIVPCNGGGFLGGINLIMSNIHGSMVGGAVDSFVAYTTVEVTMLPFHHQPAASIRFDMDLPRLHGYPFLSSSSDDLSSSGESSLFAESCSSSKQCP